MKTRNTSFIFVLFLIVTGLIDPQFAAAQSGACTIDHDHEAEDVVEPFFIRPANSARLEGAAELPLKGSRSFKLNTTEGTWLALDVSPDGKKIVFAMLGDIYEMPFTGGKAKQLTSGIAFDCQPKYSPDGKSIAFISDRDGAENAYIMNAETAVVGKQITKSRDEYFQGLECVLMR